jgi:DNA-binding PadR family transcriptional regulator
MAFERRLELVRTVLGKLERQPMRWTPLLKATIQKCGSPPQLYYILKFLERNGFVQRKILNKKQHWTITEKGKELWKALSNQPKQ